MPATKTKIIDLRDSRGGGKGRSAGRATNAPAAKGAERSCVDDSEDPAEAEVLIIEKVLCGEMGCEQPPSKPVDSVAKQNPAGAFESTKSATTRGMPRHPRATSPGLACGYTRPPKLPRSKVQLDLG